MAERPDEPKREPLVVGDVFLMPLQNGMLSACRVMYKIDHAAQGFTADAWMVVGCEWIGSSPPSLDDVSLRLPLRLTHHWHAAMGSKFSQAWLAGPVPTEFKLLGNVLPMPEEITPRLPFQTSWDSLRNNAVEQWRWDNEREGVLAQDALQSAAFKARQDELERLRKISLKTMTYAQFSKRKLFCNWGPPTPKAMIAASRRLMIETAARLESLGPEPGREAARAILRDCILAFNQLDADHGHRIETQEREDICAHFNELAYIAGFESEPSLADEWRDW